MSDNSETKTITGWLIIDWRKESHRTRQNKPKASVIGANEIYTKLKVEVEIPEVETTTLSAKARVPKPQVHASDLETLDEDELPSWTNVADRIIEEQYSDIVDAETAEDYDNIVRRMVADVLLNTPGMVPPDVVEDYVHNCVMETSRGGE